MSEQGKDFHEKTIEEMTDQEIEQLAQEFFFGKLKEKGKKTASATEIKAFLGSSLFKHIMGVMPYFQEEAEKYKADPENYFSKQFNTASTDPKVILPALGEMLKEMWGRAVDRKNESPEEIVDTLISITPQKHLIPNNKLANKISDIVDAGNIGLIVSGNRQKKEIVTACILSYEGDNVKISSRRPFTAYDREVADAVASLFVYGHESHIVTPAMVYRAMVHATETETPSAQQIGAITKSLDKMRFIRVVIDCSEELKSRNLNLNGEQVRGGKIDTYLLNMEKTEIKAGGQKTIAYKIKSAPILYDYARLVNQVITIPADLLDIRDETGAKVSNTERRIAVKGYLMRRIKVMQGKNNTSRNILYSTIYNEVCEDAPTEKEQRAIKDYVDIVLKCWVRKKLIKGYTVTTSGKKKTGVAITLNGKQGQSLGE